mgnify:CR=1 FL=1
MLSASTLQFLFQLAKGISRQFGPNCEVVVHDLDSNDPNSSIVAIENGHVTGRKVGDGPSHVVLEALRSGRENHYASVVHMREVYDRRRRIMVEGFRRMGLDCFEPRGAFYVFPGIGRTGLSSEAFCEQLLRAQKVACVPGTAFGESGEGHIRCSYAQVCSFTRPAELSAGRFAWRRRGIKWV